jgi:hypothetical protein
MQGLLDAIAESKLKQRAAMLKMKKEGKNDKEIREAREKDFEDERGALESRLTSNSLSIFTGVQ